MKLRDIYARPGKTFSVEFYPPKDDAGIERLFAEVEKLKELNLGFCSVTYGAGGSTQGTTLEIVRRIHAESAARGHVPPHGRQPAQAQRPRGARRSCATTRSRTSSRSPATRRAASTRPTGRRTPRATTTRASSSRTPSRSTTAGSRSRSPAFPEVHPRAVSRESDLKYLKAKVDAGADIVVTQLFYDNDDYFRYVEDVRAIGVEVPIVPGLMLIQSSAQCRRIASMCGSRIPADLEPAWRRSRTTATPRCSSASTTRPSSARRCWTYGVPGFHFYSLNKARGVSSVFENLQLQTLAAAG